MPLEESLARLAINFESFFESSKSFLVATEILEGDTDTIQDQADVDAVLERLETLNDCS